MKLQYIFGNPSGRTKKRKKSKKKSLAKRKKKVKNKKVSKKIKRGVVMAKRKSKKRKSHKTKKPKIIKFKLSKKPKRRKRNPIQDKYVGLTDGKFKGSGHMHFFTKEISKAFRVAKKAPTRKRRGATTRATKLAVHNIKFDPDYLSRREHEKSKGHYPIEVIKQMNVERRILKGKAKPYKKRKTKIFSQKNLKKSKRLRQALKSTSKRIANPRFKKVRNLKRNPIFGGGQMDKFNELLKKFTGLTALEAGALVGGTVASDLATLLLRKHVPQVAQFYDKIKGGAKTVNALLIGGLCAAGHKFAKTDTQKTILEAVITSQVVQLASGLTNVVGKVVGLQGVDFTPTMRGVDYTPLSGIPQGLRGVDFTPMAGIPQGLGREGADFGSFDMSDYGGGGGYTEGRKSSAADFGRLGSDDDIPDLDEEASMM